MSPGITVNISLQRFGGQKKSLACQHARLEELSLIAALVATAYRDMRRPNPHTGRAST